MLGSGTRDARRTERYLDGLIAADERRASEIPVDTELDPAVRSAARELRARLTRVHPSFRFEDALAARLADGAVRLRAGLPIADTTPAAARGTVAPFRSRSARAAQTDLPAAAIAAATVAVTATDPASPPARARAMWSAATFRRLPDIGARPSRPLIVGGVGVGVASAAISIGAVYVAWRYSHPASGRMGRAVRAAHGRTGHSGQSRRTGVINGILGVVS
jgi:hypothetical protein